MTCFFARNLLTELVDDVLDPARRTEVEQHLAGCETCRQEYRELQQVRDLVRGLPIEQAPSDFSARVRNRIDHPGWIERIRRGLTVGVEQWKPVTASIATAACIVVGVAVLLRSEPRDQALREGARSENTVIAQAPQRSLERENKFVMGEGHGGAEFGTAGVRAKGDLNQEVPSAGVLSSMDGEEGPPKSVGELGGMGIGGLGTKGRTTATSPSLSSSSSPSPFPSTSPRTLVAKATQPSATPPPPSAAEEVRALRSSKAKKAESGGMPAPLGKAVALKSAPPPAKDAAANARQSADESVSRESDVAPEPAFAPLSDGDARADALGAASAPAAPAPPAPSEAVAGKKEKAQIRARMLVTSEEGPADVASAVSAVGGRIHSPSPPYPVLRGAGSWAALVVEVPDLAAFQQQLAPIGSLELPAGSQMSGPGLLRIEVRRQ